TYNLTASGINNRIIINDKTYFFTSFSYSATEYSNKNLFYTLSLKEIPVTDQNEINSQSALTTYINHKFNSRHTNRSGLILSMLSYAFDVENNTNVAQNEFADFFINSNGQTLNYQLYTQSKFCILENLNLSAGLHFMYFDLNNEIILEPRLGIKWNFASRHSFSLAYGKHSRIEPLRIYMTEILTVNGYNLINSDLKVTKAHHFIFSYDLKLGRQIHLKLEPYYQLLYDVPVIEDSSFSMINYTCESFFTEKMNNEGTGKNCGIDITMEKFMDEGFYYMFTSSVYSSTYKGGDRIEHSSRYNQNYVFNLLAGKEWQTGKKNTFGLNGKLTVIGGKRYSPVDLVRSSQYKYVVYDDSRIYEDKLPASCFVDFSLNYTVNKRQCSHSLIIQLKNLLMQEESFGHAYNYKTDTVEPYGLTIIYPFISYKIQF
ncbi:MAG: TonB-dependent receptor, partial [Methanobacterium sp.]|nr:TonB-dependent receptor [Methanobacterium sp.]